MSHPPEDPAGRHDPYAALRVRDFRLYLSGNLLANLGMHMQTIAVGWEIYERTGSAMALGWIGVVEFGPVALLALPAGQLADRMDRRRIVLAANIFIALASLGLSVVSAMQGPVLSMYGLLFMSAVARAIQQPAKHALVPQIVPRERLNNAITWNSSGFELAAIVGPGVGGVLLWVFHRAAPVYALDALATFVFVATLAVMSSRPAVRETEVIGERSLLAGLRFVWRTKAVLGAITLDMFAVLLGGVIMLLPIYAKDILAVGPTGLGMMRAAPSIGALSMAFLLAHRPPLRRAGRDLLLSVVGFGVVIICFGLSRSFPLSLLMLYLYGAFDTVSVIVRHTMVQLMTPDEMRGRVSAINGLFIGASNQLGGARAGFVAGLFGPVFSVVSGGIGTLAVVAGVAVFLPQIRRYGRLDGELKPTAEAEHEATREAETKLEA